MIGISSSCCTSGSESKSKNPYDLTIAFIGNPSVGKSVFFSRLTGVGVEVSNYPGTTVALKKGIVKARGKTIEIVDLPGIYSLGVTNEDEKVTKQFLIEDRPDIIINVVDASREKPLSDPSASGTRYPYGCCVKSGRSGCRPRDSR